MPKHCLYYFCSLLLCQLVSSCLPVKQLPEGSYLLYNQQLSGVPAALDADVLEALLQQEPNRTFLYLPVMPYLSAYYAGKKSYERNLPKYKVDLAELQLQYVAELSKVDSLMERLTTIQRSELSEKQYKDDSVQLERIRNKTIDLRNQRVAKLQERINEGNWLMRTVGEPPALADSLLMEAGARQLERYLHTQGYFAAQVNVQTDTTGRRLNADYKISAGTRWQLRKIAFSATDSVLQLYLNKWAERSGLQTSIPYNEPLLENERTALTRYLKNNGFYGFSQEALYFEVDTLRAPFQADIKLIAAPDSASNGTVRFTIDEVVMETGADYSRTLSTDSTTYQNVLFLSRNNHYHERLLRTKLRLNPGQLYNLADVQRTQIALNSMDVFKFVNIRMEEMDSARLRAHIFTSDHDRYQYSIEGGLNLAQAQRLPGPFVSVGLKARNVFGSADVVELNASLLIEAQASATNVSNGFFSQEYGGNLTVSLPKVWLPVSKAVRAKLKLLNPSTRFQLGLFNVNRPEYERTNLQLSGGFQWQTGVASQRNRLYRLSLVDLSLISSRVTPEFERLLQDLNSQGNQLILAFENSFISGINFSFTQTNGGYGLNNSIKRPANYLNIYAEWGGPYLSALEDLLGEVDEQVFNLRYYKYVRLKADYRKLYPLGKMQLAFRLHSGIAAAYGQSEALPYEKYLFTGGSSSLRAWRPRRVGPGSYAARTEEGEISYAFEQPGELLFESSVEWRHPLFSVVEWAWFIDAGNVWLLNADPTRPGGSFGTDFWRELAVGGGAGVRLDFDLLLIRLDVGIKLYDPARGAGERFLLPNINLRQPFGAPGQAEVNFGIGYPF
jgi:outer membrane protein assembly factor BamA